MKNVRPNQKFACDSLEYCRISFAKIASIGKRHVELLRKKSTRKMNAKNCLCICLWWRLKKIGYIRLEISKLRNKDLIQSKIAKIDLADKFRPLFISKIFLIGKHFTIIQNNRGKRELCKAGNLIGVTLEPISNPLCSKNLFRKNQIGNIFIKKIKINVGNFQQQVWALITPSFK